MKYLYKTPEIIVEELKARDVLCASSEGFDTNPEYTENRTLFKSLWEALGGEAFWRCEIQCRVQFGLTLNIQILNAEADLASAFFITVCSVFATVCSESVDLIIILLYG